MENRFKMRISRIFRSSFGSCKSKNISDVIDNKPVFYPQNRQHNYNLVELISPKPCPFPSMYTPKCPENFQTPQSCTFPNSGVRRTLSKAVSIYCHNSTSNKDGRKCPPASPILPLSYESQNIYYQRTAKKKKKKKNNKNTRRTKIKRFEFEEFASFDYKGLFSSDEENEVDDDKTTFFSSRSFTSDSSEFRQKSNMPRSRESRIKDDEAKSVKGSLAVVKKSRDPYSDFRDSMLEMIIENQMFAAKDLEKLLECFLSLNSHHHHGVIVEVFTEICEVFCSNWSS